MSVEIEKLNEIAVKMSRIEATQEAQARSVIEMATSVNRLVDKLEKSDDIAKEADQRAKSAHHRIDELRAGELKSLQDNQTYLWRAVITTLITGVVGGAIALLWKTIGGA